MSHTPGRARILVLTFFLFAAVFSGCDFQNISMADYFKDHAATAAGLGFIMKSETFNGTGPGSAQILIPSGADACLELTLDNKRSLDLRLTLTGDGSDNVRLKKQGPEKVLITTIRAPEVGEFYNLTLEIQDPYGLRTFEPYRFPTILCVSSDTAMVIAVPGQLPNDRVTYAPESGITLWTLPSVNLSAVTPLSISLEVGATLTVGGNDYNPTSPYPLDFTGGPLAFKVTAASGHSQDYVVSVRHVQASRGTGVDEQYYLDLAGALSAATSGTPASPDTITVLDDITHTGTLDLAGKHVKLTVNQSKTITLGTGHTGSLFTLSGSSSLTLAGNGGVLTVDGNNLDIVSLIRVTDGALKLDNGAALQNAKGTLESAIHLSGGTFTMAGGKITGMDFKWGGVSLTGGTFTMSGGEITANGKPNGNGAGGVYVAGGTFAMLGGEITGNKTVLAGGGGVYVGGGTSTMSGGKISGNAARVNAGAGGNGGGVYMFGGTFAMSGGEISGNTATNGGGGGVYVEGGTFTMPGGEISGNTATGGGGVYMEGGTFTMQGGEISGNTAAGFGGGGGVYMGGGTFTMPGGEISANTAITSGGGVYMGDGTFNMSGGAVVAGNNNVYLAAGKTVTVTGNLTSTQAAVIKPQVTANGTQVLTDNSYTEANCDKFALDPSLDGFSISRYGKLVALNASGGAALALLAVPQGTAGSPATVVMPGNAVVNAPVVIPSGSFIELVPLPGQNIVIERGGGNTGGLFTVNSGAELYLLNSSDNTGSLTIDGKNTQTGSSLITVNSGGKLVLNGDDVTIKGGSTTGQGGAVNLSGNGSVFDMSAGKITGNTSSTSIDTQGGGAVYVGSGAAFNMSGGIIGGTSAADKNSARTGGAVLVDGGNFTMSGSAKIAYNEATTRAGGVQVNNNSTFTMEGSAVIERNTRLSSGAGGASNTNDARSGGGVTVVGSSAIFNLKDTTKIRDNSASEGGGVLLYQGGKLYMSGGEISSNTAVETGGGVRMDSGGTYMEVTGGTIHNNEQTSTTSGWGGGGVHVGGGATLLINFPADKTNIFSNIAARTAYNNANVQFHDPCTFKVRGADETAY